MSKSLYRCFQHWKRPSKVARKSFTVLCASGVLPAKDVGLLSIAFDASYTPICTHPAGDGISRSR